jgi:DNA invertase Pin-like site-specific DNA recombinase
VFRAEGPRSGSYRGLVGPGFRYGGLFGKLAPGDAVTVTRIDRLARSTFDLFAIVKRIVDAKAQFRSLAEPWADTGTSTGRLMLAVLGGLADVERDLIRTRTAKGRSRAKDRGQHMGRPPSLTPAQQKEATRRRAQGATLQELADSYDRSISTMRRATRTA